MGGTLKETADEITNRGGKGIPVACDHSKDEEIKQLFDRIKREQGRLDVLVNNAYSAVQVTHQSVIFMHGTSAGNVELKSNTDIFHFISYCPLIGALLFYPPMLSLRVTDIYL